MTKTKTIAENNSEAAETNETEQYLELVRRRKDEQVKTGNVRSLPMPSGAVWKYTPFSVASYAVGGVLPMFLLAKLNSGKNQPSKPPTEDELMEAGLSWMIITREILLNNLVSPRISLEPAKGCILPTQIDPEDFDFFKNFIMSGGQSSQNSFRQ